MLFLLAFINVCAIAKSSSELDESVVARGPIELPASMKEEAVGGLSIDGRFDWNYCPSDKEAKSAECAYGKSFSKRINTDTYWGLCSSLMDDYKSEGVGIKDVGSNIGVTLSGKVCGDVTYAIFSVSVTIDMWVCGNHLQESKSVHKKFGEEEIVIFNEPLGLMWGWTDKLILKAKISRGTVSVQAALRLYPSITPKSCAQIWTDWISVYSMSELEAESKLAALPAPEHVEAQSAQLTENSLASFPVQDYLVHGLAIVGVSSLIYAIANQCNQKSYTQIFAEV